MNSRTADAIAKISAELRMPVIRADDEAVVIEDESGRLSVYRTSNGWIVANPVRGGGWRSSDAPAAFLAQHSEGFVFFSANTLDGLAEAVRTYPGPVSALRSLAKAMKG